MRLTITSVDQNPPELGDQLPFEIELLRMMPGGDRPDYWLGWLARPLRWIAEGEERSVDHVIVCARWVGTQIAPKARDLPIGIAYVTDLTLLGDEALDFRKCAYVAIGTADETDGHAAPEGRAAADYERLDRRRI